MDLNGEFALVGAVLGAGIEVGMQTFKNYRQGCDLLNTHNYDWMDVGAAAAIGAIAPGWLTVGKTSLTSGRAITNLTEQLGRAQTANRIVNNAANIADVLIPQLGFQGLKWFGKQVTAAGGAKDCTCSNSK